MSATTLAVRRTALCKGRYGVAERMSPSRPVSRVLRAALGGRAGGACSVATGRFMIRPGRARAPSGWPGTALLLHPAEGLPARLAASCGRVEAGLPAVSDPRLVPHQEPDHHVDARIPAGDRVRL